MRYHPGIRIDKIPVKGIAGLIFVIGVITLFLIGIPATRAFLVIVLAGGLLLAPIIYWWRNRTRS